MPTLVVHRSYNHAGELPDLIDRAQTACGVDAAIAVATRLPVQPPARARAFLDACGTASLRIADPEIYKLVGPEQAPHAQQPAKTTQYAYGSGPVPAAPNRAWVREVLDAQTGAGANVHLSASGWVDSTNGAAKLAVAMQFVQATRNELSSGEPMFVNLTLHRAWLTDASLRGRLLQEIVESSEPLWWLRVAWPPLRFTNYTQLAEPDLLDGYKELAEVAAAEGKTVFLPNSGLTGWVATALGASGFSTGMSGAERCYEDKAPQDGGPGVPAKERFFDQNVLHTILRSDRGPLRRQSGYDTCTCIYCQRLGAAWPREVEHLHYLLSVAGLTAALGRRNRRATALAMVTTAKTFRDSLRGAAQLTNESSPRHLDLWEKLLQ